MTNREMNALYTVALLVLCVVGSNAQAEEERVSTPVSDLKIEASAGGTFLVVQGSAAQKPVKGDARGVYLQGNIQGLSKPCQELECTGEPFVRTGRLFVGVHRNSDPPFVVSNMKDPGPKRPEIEVGTLEDRVVTFKSHIQATATYEEVIPGKWEKMGGLEPRSSINVTLTFAASVPTLDGISRKCQKDSDCILAFDQCGRCYSVNRAEKKTVEEILWRSCLEKPAVERLKCKYTAQSPVKCIESSCE